jgi:signal transduction histidine kinase
MFLRAETHHFLLTVAPVGRDAELICELLPGVACKAYAALHDIPQDLWNGASGLVISEEALDPASIQCLSRTLQRQPAWSDFPTIVLTGGGASTHLSMRMVKMREPLGNVTLLERPLRSVTLVSAVRSALRARERQYQLRDYLSERKLMLDHLSKSHSELETAVSQRTAALRKLSQRLLRLQDEERRRIARDLHDSTGQVLTALKISLAMLEQKVGEIPSIRQELSDIIELADQALQEIRAMSYLLHPPTLDHSGFISAARWYVSGLAERSGLAAKLDLPELEIRLPDNVETVLFRVLQESLTNVLRHANAGYVHIRFSATRKSATLEVEDDGVGISPDFLVRFLSNETNGGVGLAGMRERIHELNGELLLNSQGRGTTLRVELPL